MIRRPLAAAAAALLLATVASGASFSPELHFRTLSAGRVSVHFHQGLYAMARQAASLAEEILTRHERRYGVHVRHLDLVLADVSDDPNGSATPLPFSRVQISAAGPAGDDEFGNYENWLRYVLTHELAHIVHLEEGRGLVRAGRKVLGRAPFLFPNLATPTWMIEGLATFEETQGTAFGRGRNPDSRMVLRMAALEDAFPGEDQATVTLDRWPGGQAGYLFGEAFLRSLDRHEGPQVLPALGRAHAGHLLPYEDDLTARRVTGRSFHDLWKRWRVEAQNGFEREAAAIRARGLTASRPLTTLGVRQVAPQFSPDGRWIAYTSRVLTRFRCIRLVRPDGSEDHKLVDRNGGTGLGWTPDGKQIVFDEPETYRLFFTRSDLRALDVATGRVRRLTRGLRAREPDVSPDGRTVVFVRERADRGELALLDLASGRVRYLTLSASGTRWSGPRWDPTGRTVAASRWTEGSWLDLVLVDGRSGAVRELTHDRAKDVEPIWTPDGAHLVFRSDRDGVSNLYALRLADGAILRVTNVLGGAFGPDVSPDGTQIAFANYSSRGYDVHVMALDLAALGPADPFEDRYPAARPMPPAATEAAHRYRPWPAALPRLWTPYATANDQVTLGAATFGADPLLRHIWVADLHYGFDAKRPSFRGAYQYDRLVPTVTLTVEDTTDAARIRVRELVLGASLPVTRSLRSAQSLALAWHRKRETVLDTARPPFDLGGVQASWSFGNAKQYPFSISPTDGFRARVAAVREDPAFGSSLSLLKGIADLRAYLRRGEADTFVVRAGAGTTWGEPSFRRSYAVGGFPDGTLFDVVGTNLSVLRGYPDDAFTGRSFAHANLEYRLPLALPERGYRTYPVFIRHLHAAVFADAAQAWTGAFRLRDTKTAAGVALGSDTILAHGFPFTATVGVARGFAGGGETRVYFRAGLAF